MACNVSILKSIRQIFVFQVYMHRVCYLKAVQANALLALLSKEINILGYRAKEPDALTLA